MNTNPQAWILRALKPRDACPTAREIRDTGPESEAPAASTIRYNLEALQRQGMVECLRGTGPRNADVYRLTPQGRVSARARLQ